ncbi:hypothetical protein EGR52_06850 [bacterium]|nr:hypothetical protein [bacterium]
MDELKKIGQDIYINDYEKSVLLKYNIDVTTCKLMSEVLFLIDNFILSEDLEDNEYDEIEYVANNLSERMYYMQNK